MSLLTDSRCKDKWILLRTIELLARKLVAKGYPESSDWDETATIAFSQATVEYDASEVKR
jgi:hypothetical protein